MKKIMNDPVNFVDEMLQGVLIAHPNQLRIINEDLRCVVKAGPGIKNKVGLATGGGSGHLPLFLGYVGDGLLDGCAVGGVFQSPSSDQMLEVTKAIDNGAGVLYIYGNYGGDIMNFDMAAEMAEMDNIKVEQVIAGEDVASAPKGEEGKRRRPSARSCRAARPRRRARRRPGGLARTGPRGRTERRRPGRARPARGPRPR